MGGAAAGPWDRDPFLPAPLPDESTSLAELSKTPKFPRPKQEARISLSICGDGPWAALGGLRQVRMPAAHVHARLHDID